MKTYPASIAIVAIMFGCLGSFRADACASHIDLAVIEQRMADPNLQGELKERANGLKTRAAAAIHAGHRDEGRKLYYQLMDLLGISQSSGRFHC